MSTDMCGPRSPHEYRIRVAYSAVAIWKELLGVVAKPFYTGQEVLVQEIISQAPSTREKLRLLQADTGRVCPDGYRPQVVETAHTFTIEGTGASTTGNEIVQHIGIVAKCKILGFLENTCQDSSNIVGQFGVGLYSTFVVAGRVEVFTKTYDATKGSQSCPTHVANVAKRLGVPSTQARRAVRTGDRVIATLSVAVVAGMLFA